MIKSQQDVEHRHGKCQTRFDIVRYQMKDFLHVTDIGLTGFWDNLYKFISN